MSIDPKILKRIQKLLCLGANNDQVHEANNAMKKAAQLAEEYGLALSDVNQETGEVGNITKGEVNLAASKHSCWANGLASVVSSCFNCKPVITRRRNGQNIMTFIGTPTDLEMTMWYYKMIRLKTVRGASAKYRLVEDQKMYGRGVLVSMSKRLKEMFTEEQEKIRTPETTALVLVKTDAVEKAMGEMYPRLKASKSTYKMGTNITAYKEGMDDGANMALHRGNIEKASVGSLE